MGKQSDRVREALMDAAEELFARHGIDAVSNRGIAEQAGSANHSAVAYHFGGRPELLQALVTRYAEPLTARRRQLLDELDGTPTLHDVVRCRLLPLVELMDSLPRPSWRAQFLNQVRSTPSVVSVLTDSVAGSLGAEDFASPELEGISRSVIRGRSWILGHMVLGVFAEYEVQRNAGTASGSWSGVGSFLIDAVVGMLAAPVTESAGRFEASAPPLV
ncbi:TetR/AcrR family transcriptional regulator [Microbacterium sp. GXF7504]